jgi:hypothetical protein
MTDPAVEYARFVKRLHSASDLLRRANGCAEGLTAEIVEPSLISAGNDRDTKNGVDMESTELLGE